ncbi:unnamed protein product [Agarophyton chilense]
MTSVPQEEFSSTDVTSSVSESPSTNARLSSIVHYAHICVHEYVCEETENEFKSCGILVQRDAREGFIMFTLKLRYSVKGTPLPVTLGRLLTLTAHALWLTTAPQNRSTRSIAINVTRATELINEFKRLILTTRPNAEDMKSTTFIPTTPFQKLRNERSFVPQTSTSIRPVTVATPARRAPSCVWVERSAEVLIEMPREEAYEYYTDLEAMPQWSPWLKSVVVDDIDGDVSRWTLASQGITISWQARNTQVIPGEIIAWKSETGLSNRGRVLFRDAKNDSGCKLTLAVEFDVPGAVARIFDFDFVGRFVESTLLADLKRFRSIALLNRRKRLRSTEVSKSKN